MDARLGYQPRCRSKANRRNEIRIMFSLFYLIQLAMRKEFWSSQFCSRVHSTMCSSFCEQTSDGDIIDVLCSLIVQSTTSEKSRIGCHSSRSTALETSRPNGLDSYET